MHFFHLNTFFLPSILKYTIFIKLFILLKIIIILLIIIIILTKHRCCALWRVSHSPCTMHAATSARSSSDVSSSHFPLQLSHYDTTGHACMHAATSAFSSSHYDTTGHACMHACCHLSSLLFTRVFRCYVPTASLYNYLFKFKLIISYF